MVRDDPSPLAVLIGSTSDQGVVDDSGLHALLTEFCLRYESVVLSSDRDPEELRAFCLSRETTLRMVIAVAGGVPNLPVVVKSWLPSITVVCVPIESEPAFAMYSLTTPADRPIVVSGWGIAGLRKAAYIARDFFQNW